MSILEHKTKMISLRLSQVEFDFLKTRYPAYGARNVSDLARLAVQRMMHSWDNPANNVAAKLVALDGRVIALESELASIRSLVKVTTDAAQEES
ncbi:MAG TPA: hypothetical protein VE957_12190 [Terriglobales bacterium]|nr:hypothetical protein [Terriglobales bacterium]